MKFKQQIIKFCLVGILLIISVVYFNGSLREDLASSESLTSLSGSISGSVSEQGASLSTKPFEVNGSPETGRLKLNLNGDGRGLTEVVIPRVINSLISPQELSPGALLASGTLDEILNPEDEVDEDDKPLLDWFINRMANCHQDKPWHLYLTRLDLDSFYMGNEDIQMDFTENEDKDVIKFNANVQNFKIGAAVKFVWGEDTSGVMDTLQCHGEDWEISLDVTLQGAELSMNVNLELDQESNRLKVKNIQQFSIGMSELIINDVQENLGIWDEFKVRTAVKSVCGVKFLTSIPNVETSTFLECIEGLAFTDDDKNGLMTQIQEGINQSLGDASAITGTGTNGLNYDIDLAAFELDESNDRLKTDWNLGLSSSNSNSCADGLSEVNLNSYSMGSTSSDLSIAVPYSTFNLVAYLVAQDGNFCKRFNYDVSGETLQFQIQPQGKIQSYSEGGYLHLEIPISMEGSARSITASYTGTLHLRSHIGLNCNSGLSLELEDIELDNLDGSITVAGVAVSSTGLNSAANNAIDDILDDLNSTITISGKVINGGELFGIEINETVQSTSALTVGLNFINNPNSCESEESSTTSGIIATPMNDDISDILEDHPLQEAETNGSLVNQHNQIDEDSAVGGIAIGNENDLILDRVDP